MSENPFEPGTFVKVTMAWSTDLEDPCWVYMLSEEQAVDDYNNALVLKGKFKPDQQFGRFHRTNMDGEVLQHFGDRTYGYFDSNGKQITRETIVPVDEVPADVMAVFVEWCMLGEPEEARP